MPVAMVPILTTARLRLRELRTTDFEAFARIHADAEVMRFLGGVASPAESWRKLAMLVGHWYLRGFGMWAVESLATGELVGRVGFHQPEGWPDFELGWTIGREHWGQGYATEAAQAALAYGFVKMSRAHVISLIHPQNVRSIAVARRLGESYEGDFVLDGTLVHVFGIHQETWFAQ
jgi:RimJ/RimL family protein N-acetyltransferase